ncbi:short-chain dehydrogenase [Mycobacterium florentinum]|uniref:Peroxisomal trans-2-enoyl-CoA reductase n=1 Tax=Mycobacterium florentinum TaxID=292462 RepID=A0A1X1U995_MYCFL|nr:SDR family oxidoreductase [Mycobacterium florentinum]MCV7408652.1 SDR family oxidoreductase [Mycobacterium florentinum]ORV53391.1 short-chain dehydrogenase [Mycobacterium florentinum]BBX77444.1 short-chain dehydrogenase [Mycobacterium florentinum]
MSQVLRSDAHRGAVALVTGGGTGIGRAVALDLARCGADVVIAGRRPEPLQKAAAEVESLGARALPVATDVRDDEQVQRLVDRCIERFGRIDILVNNAGGQFSAPAEQITVKGWRAVHRVTVDAAWAVTRQVAVRTMIPQRAGTIFFLAFSPRRGIATMVHASAARAALENLAAGLALEWSRFGIRTICIAPGTIATDGMQRNYSPADRANWEAAVPLRRFGTPAEVSEVIAFLASPSGSYVTGTTVVIDGGADALGAGQPAPELDRKYSERICC